MKIFQKPEDETVAHVPHFKTTPGYKLAKTWHPVVAVLQQSAAFSSCHFNMHKRERKIMQKEQSYTNYIMKHNSDPI